VGLASNKPETIPIALHAAEKADYGVDPRQVFFPVSLEIVEAVLLDDMGQGADVPERIVEFLSKLGDPVQDIAPDDEGDDQGSSGDTSQDNGDDDETQTSDTTTTTQVSDTPQSTTTTVTTTVTTAVSPSVTTSPSVTVSPIVTVKVTPSVTPVSTPDSGSGPDPPDDEPDADGDSDTTIEGVAVTTNVLANDDLGKQPTMITSKTDGINGTVSCTAIQCTYTPNIGFSGVDTYTYNLWC